jgi:hypothetical protein
MSLSGVKRTWPIAVQMSAFDPKRTLVTQFAQRRISPLGNTVAPKVCPKIVPSDAGVATIKP